MAQQNWKATPVTIGVLLALLGGTFFVVRATRAGEEDIKSITREVITHHCEKDVDMAHPGIPASYTKRQELKEAVYQVNERLSRIEAVQEQILQRLAIRNRRRDR